jgi:hypothetical protein
MNAGPMLAAAVAMLLCGCQAERPKPTRQGQSEATAEQPAKPKLANLASLEGEWRVAGIDGEPFDQPVGLALSASKEEIWWAPRCAQFERSYEIAGARVTFSPARWAKSRAAADRPPPCAIGLPAGLQGAFRAIDSATMVGRTPENGVLISGGGHSLLLFSQ